MKKGLSVILALLMIFASCAISASSAASYKTIKGGFNYTYAKKVCASINTVRKKAKLKTLVYDNALTEAAMKRAAELDVKFSSYRPNKQYCSTAYKGALNLDENIASGPQTPAKVFDLWLNNMKQAKTNIYRKTHTRIGIGCFYNEYGEFTWVLAMCSGKSGGACKTTGIKYVNVNVSLNSKVNTAYSTVKGVTAIKSVKVKTNKYVYDGKSHKPALVITDAKGKTVSSKLYKVTYSGTIKNIADYYVYVRELYRGKTHKVKVSVIPKSTQIKSLTPKTTSASSPFTMR